MTFNTADVQAGGCHGQYMDHEAGAVVDCP